jgi:hypothetical protein
MPDKVREEVHLDLANLHIVEAEKMISRQRELLTRFREEGREVHQEAQLLALMCESLLLMHRHRAAIAARLDEET